MTTKLISSNERTYQEVEYLKKSLGPLLVAALAEISIRIPADPIEYLGHWLLRWRYNEELKKRDVQNAMDIVKERQGAQMKEGAAAIAQENQPHQVSSYVPDDLYSRGLLQEGDQEEHHEEEEELITDTLFVPQHADTAKMSLTSQKKVSNVPSKKISVPSSRQASVMIAEHKNSHRESTKHKSLSPVGDEIESHKSNESDHHDKKGSLATSDVRKTSHSAQH